MGAVLTLDRSFASSWALRHVTSSLGRVFSLLLSKDFPRHQAYILLRHSTVHSLTFLSRVLPPDVLRPAAAWFEEHVCLVCQRLFALGSLPLLPFAGRLLSRFVWVVLVSVLFSRSLLLLSTLLLVLLFPLFLVWVSLAVALPPRPLLLQTWYRFIAL